MHFDFIAYTRVPDINAVIIPNAESQNVPLNSFVSIDIFIYNIDLYFIFILFMYHFIYFSYSCSECKIEH